MAKRKGGEVHLRTHALERWRLRVNPSEKPKTIRNKVKRRLYSELKKGASFNSRGALEVEVEPGILAICYPSFMGGWDVVTVIREGAIEDMEEKSKYMAGENGYLVARAVITSSAMKPGMNSLRNRKSKQYLRQVRRLKNIVNAKLEQIEMLRSMSINITVNLDADRVQETKSHDKIEKIICKVVDLEKEITDDIDALIDLKKEIIRQINAVQDDDYRLLLTLRYLNFKTWEQIAVEMNFTFQWVHELHKKALIEFDKSSSYCT